MPKIPKIPKSSPKPKVGNSKPSSFSNQNNNTNKQQSDYARQLRDSKKNINNQSVDYSNYDYDDFLEEESNQYNFQNPIKKQPSSPSLGGGSNNGAGAFVDGFKSLAKEKTGQGTAEDKKNVDKAAGELVKKIGGLPKGIDKVPGFEKAAGKAFRQVTNTEKGPMSKMPGMKGFNKFQKSPLMKGLNQKIQKGVSDAINGPSDNNQNQDNTNSQSNDFNLQNSINKKQPSSNNKAMGGSIKKQGIPSPKGMPGANSKGFSGSAPKGVKGVKGMKGMNIVQDAKDASRGLESTGSALSGDYKKMDASSKKQADMDTAQGIKAVAGYTGIGKPIVAAIDAAEQIPVAGKLVKFAERKIGQNVNKKLGKIGKMPGAGKAVGGLAKGIGGMGSQALGGGKAAYNQKQRSDIKASGINSGMISGAGVGMGGAQQQGQVSQSDEARIARELNRQKQKQQMEEQKEMAKQAAKQAAKEAVKKAVKKGMSQLAKILLRTLISLAVNPITWIVILAFCLMAMLIGAFSPGSSGQKPPLDSNQQSIMCSQYKGSTGSVGVECKDK